MKKQYRLVPLMLLGYVSPAILLLGPHIGIKAVNHDGRLVQIWVGAALLIALTLWNLWILLRERRIHSVKPTGTVSMLSDTSGGIHPIFSSGHRPRNSDILKKT